MFPIIIHVFGIFWLGATLLNWHDFEDPLVRGISLLLGLNAMLWGYLCM